MACALTAGNSCTTIASSSSSPTGGSLFIVNKHSREPKKKQTLTFARFSIRASSDESDCNVEECAPDKEVGKVSMEWLAGEKTKVVGTFPPRNRPWTGYVEKDTAGQTNIYSVEPAVYVAETAISSGNAGSSADGSENTVAVAAGLALTSIAAASLILLQVGKTPPQMQTLDYSGPSLSYYISKFKPSETVSASVPSETATSTSSAQEESSAPEVSAIQVESAYQPDASTPSSEMS